MFPTAIPFRREVWDISAVHIELRNVLDSRGANLQKHCSHGVINTLAHGLLEETENSQAAVEMARAIIAAGRLRRTDLNNSPTTQSSTPSAMIDHAGAHAASGELAHKISMPLKESDKKVSRYSRESWMNFIDNYTQISRQ